LRVFENRVLRGIFDPKRQEVVGGWRRLHNEELHNFYTSQNTIRIIKNAMGGASSMDGRDEKYAQSFGWKT